MEMFVKRCFLVELPVEMQANMIFLSFCMTLRVSTPILHSRAT